MIDRPAFDLERFSALLATNDVGRSVGYHQLVESTMPLAAEAAEAGAPHGKLILAEEQTAGRGRRGRGFHSPAGENLYFTLILRLPPETLRSLALAVPLAVCQAAVNCRVDARIKWPNDIWVGDRKLSGMLIDIDGAVAFPGIGINVNGDPTLNPELRGIATGLARELGHNIDREAFLADVCNDLERALSLPPELLHDAYASHSMILGRRITVMPAGSASSFEGIATAIDLDGTLAVTRADGTVIDVSAADVSVRPAG